MTDKRQTEQLQAKVVQLENDGRIASVLATKVANGSQGYEQTLRQLQAEVQALRKQLRAQQAQTTALRGREVHAPTLRPPPPVPPRACGAKRRHPQRPGAVLSWGRPRALLGPP